jgi:hypothetical protein
MAHVRKNHAPATAPETSAEEKWAMVYTTEGKTAADPDTTTPPEADRKVVKVTRGLPADELKDELLRTNRETDAGHYKLAIQLHDMQERGVHQIFGYSSAEHFAQKMLGMKRRQARDLVAVGKALDKLPQIDEAFCEGRIVWTKVRSLCRIAVPKDREGLARRGDEDE